MSTAINVNQRVIDLLGIKGQYITEVTIKCSALKPLPTATVTSYVWPLVVNGDELQTATAHFHLVPVSDGLEAAPIPLDFDAMADEARARCAAYIEDRTVHHLQQFKKFCYAANIRLLTAEFAKHAMYADYSLNGRDITGFERRTTRNVVISGGSRIGKSWVSNLFDGWISPLTP